MDEVPLAPGNALDELLKFKEEGTIGHVGIGVRPRVTAEVPPEVWSKFKAEFGVGL